MIFQLHFAYVRVNGSCAYNSKMADFGNHCSLLAHSFLTYKRPAGKNKERNNNKINCWYSIFTSIKKYKVIIRIKFLKKGKCLTQSWISWFFFLQYFSLFFVFKQRNKISFVFFKQNQNFQWNLLNIIQTKKKKIFLNPWLWKHLLKNSKY